MNTRRYLKFLASLITSLILLSLFVNSTMAAAGDTTRVSVASDGTQGNYGGDNFPSISADGRYVAFLSVSSNLVNGDTNGYYDTFIHDRQTGQTTRISVASDGTQGNSSSGIPSISPGGRYVAFVSSASNLVNGDTNDTTDIFVHDNQTGLTTRVSMASDGTQANSGSNYPSISYDGRYVVFESSANNLVSGDTNGWADIFVHDLQTGQTRRVSVASDGTEGNLNSSAPSISANGRYVSFESRASNLVNEDTNSYWDIFVNDLLTGQTERVSVASDGVQGNNDSAASPSISADGLYVAFLSNASSLVSEDTNGITDIFVHDRQTGQTTRVSVASDGSEGNSYSDQPSISADGRYIAYHSSASNLVSGDTNSHTDVFIHDMQTKVTSRLSIASEGTEGNLDSRNSNFSISGNGRYVAFISAASNLIAGDTNGNTDIFVHENDVSTRIIWGNAGVTGATLSFDNGGPQTAPTFGDGDYFLEVPYNWSGTVTPSKIGYSFLPASRSYTSITEDQNGQDYTALVTISGNAGVGSATLSYTDGTPKTTTADSSGLYSFLVTYNWSGMVTPYKTGYSFSPASRSYTNITFNQTSQDYTASLNTYLLSVSKNGTGSGTVTSIPVGIACGSDCSEIYNYGSSIVLTATANTGSTFTGWGGICSGTGICTVIMDSAKSVTANFNLQTFTLNVNKGGTGIGTVTSSPTGINCGADCSEIYTYNTIITLTATPIGGSIFTGWGGACSGTGACTVTMDAKKSVTATFNLPGTTFSLIVSKSGTGSGTVTSIPAGINCGADCSENYPSNTNITLTATASADSTFGGWSGACTGTGTCIVTMNANKAVTANFEQTQQAFVDVPPDYWAASWIMRLYRAGITNGCNINPLRYCPEDPVMRAQMAIFLERGIHGSGFTPPQGSGTIFADVPISYWAVNWIEKFYSDGVTNGCGTSPLTYCPENSVTRAQMAVLLLRARNGAIYSPPAVGSITGFADVSVSYWAAAWIKQLSTEGITNGCGDGNYCPENSVTRAEMAKFLVLTFNLP